MSTAAVPSVRDATRGVRLGVPAWVLAGLLQLTACGPKAAPRAPTEPPTTEPSSTAETGSPGERDAGRDSGRPDVTRDAGSGQAAAPPSAGQAVAFPLRVSANGRYLTDQNGVPFRIHGDTAWDASVSLTLSEWQKYLDDRKAKHFNTVLVSLTNPVSYFDGSTAPRSKGASGALPFLKNIQGGAWDGDPQFALDRSAHKPSPGRFDVDFSSPNPAYFAWVDQLLAEAEKRGLLVVLTAHYMGYDRGSQDGWYRSVANAGNTQSVCYGFGQYLGARYKDFKNILWEMGVDTLPPSQDEVTRRFHKILEGIKAAGDRHLWTAHWSHDYFSLDQADFAADMEVEGVYTHGPYPALHPTYGMTRAGYARSPALPLVLLETTYEGEHAAAGHQIRSFMWGAELSGIAGVIFGNFPLWPFSANWAAALDSPGSKQMTHMASLLDSLAWHQLVPSGLGGAKTLVTSGAGKYGTWKAGEGQLDGDDWIVSAVTRDAAQLVAYVPHDHQGAFEVDMTALSGALTARWFDPSNGSSRAIGALSSTGTHAFTPPEKNSAGDRDWVLVITRE